MAQVTKAAQQNQQTHHKFRANFYLVYYLLNWHSNNDYVIHTLLRLGFMNNWTRMKQAFSVNMRLIDESFSIFYDILRIFSSQAPIPSWKFWIHGIGGITGFVNRASQVWSGKRQFTIRNHLRLTIVMQVQPRTIYISFFYENNLH